MDTLQPRVRDWVKVGIEWGEALCDPAIERANRVWNTLEYKRIQSDDNQRFVQYWSAKMRDQTGRKSVAPILRPQSKPLSYYLDWWKENNPHTIKT
jgi:hypothetical protein